METHSEDVIRSTRLAIESYFAQCAHAALDVGVEGSATVPVTAVVKDECDAVAAIVAASECPSAGTFDVARTATLRMIDAATTWLRGADKQARTAPARLGAR